MCFSAIPQAADRLRTGGRWRAGLHQARSTGPHPLRRREAQRVQLATSCQNGHRQDRSPDRRAHHRASASTTSSKPDGRDARWWTRAFDRGDRAHLDVIPLALTADRPRPHGGQPRVGEIVAAGTPEQVAEHPSSHTGRYLKEVLAPTPPTLLGRRS